MRILTFSFRQLHRRPAPGLPGQHRYLSGDPQVAERIGSIRGDVYFQDCVVQPELLGERHADLRGGVEDHQTGGIVGEAQLLRRAEHPEALHAAQRRPLDLPSPRKARSHRGERHLVPNLVVFRSADDLQRRRAADVDLGDGELFRPRVRHRFDDLRDHHPGQRLARALDPLHLEAGEREPVGELLRGRNLQIVGQPANRDPHQNCSRKRTSFSNIIRKSSTP